MLKILVNTFNKNQIALNLILIFILNCAQFNIKFSKIVSPIFPLSTRKTKAFIEVVATTSQTYLIIILQNAKKINT